MRRVADEGAPFNLPGVIMVTKTKKSTTADSDRDSETETGTGADDPLETRP